MAASLRSSLARGALAAAGALALAAPSAGPLFGFHPPEDSAGPLAARIEGPEVFEVRGEPVPVRLRIENRGDAPIRGIARMAAIDGWRVGPEAEREFSLEGRAATALEFALEAPEGVLAALYPLHAFVSFAHGGEKLTLHPILVFEARVPGPPRRAGAPEPPWAPFAVPREGAVAIWRLPARRAILRVFREERPIELPVGWLGSEERTRALLGIEAVDRGGRRDSLAVHPPWFEGRAGTAVVECPLALPEGRPAGADAAETAPLRLLFATAIRDHDASRGEPPSDGVTFRVRIAPFEAPVGAEGEVVFERHSASKRWEEAEVDLAPYSGKAVRLQLEVHPGPRGDTTCDQAFIAEPTVVAGRPPAPEPFPPASEEGSRLLGAIETGGERYEVRVWPGRRGLLDAAVGFASGERKLFVRGFAARVLGEALEDPRSPAHLLEVRAEESPGRYRARHAFRGPWGEMALAGELSVEGALLWARFRLERAPEPRPWLVARIEDLALGEWSAKALRVYAGPGNAIAGPGAFRLGFDGHQLATSFVGLDFEGGISIVEAVDVPPDRLEVSPPERRYALHVPGAQARALIPAPDVWTAARAWREACGLGASGGVEKLAGRFVFDLWGGRYAETAGDLERAFRYGLTDAVVVFHNWQRWGYDDRLPDIYPPNPRFGTLDEFRRLAETCAAHGVLFAPHDNYIDFYPDADGFTYDAIAFSASGEPVKAWFNPGPQAQSYRWRADRVREPLERNLRLIREGFAPTAYFIDVWSSIGPYDYWTCDGRFFDRVSTRNVWGEAFAWIRDYLGGAPQISESGHDQLVGWLDGAQTNHLRVSRPEEGARDGAVWRIPCADAERVPWLDAVHHHRFVLHGAGYESRYAAGLDRKLHGIYSDDYLSTEVLTGHPPMVPAAFGRDVVRKYWLLHGAMRALALRKLESVRFAGGDIHRQEVLWEGGARVWTNRGSEDWDAEGRTLPPYGFAVRARDASGRRAEAAVEELGGRVVEWSLSADGVYANARPPGPPVRFSLPGAEDSAELTLLETDGAARIAPSAEGLEIVPLPGSGKFALRLAWEGVFELLAGRMPGGPPARAEALDASGKPIGEAALRREGAWVALEVEEGPFAYRLRPEARVGALERAARGIEEHRKADAILVFRRPDGAPAAGVAVEVRQTEHAFRFGNVFRPRHYANELYRKRFRELFNFVSLLEFNWGQYEPDEGEPQLSSRMDFIRGWCQENGLTRFYGHMLVWTPQRQDKSGSLLPEWLFRYDDAERYRRLRARIEREVRAYRDVGIVWDVVNEAIHCRRWGAWEKPGWTDEPIDDVVPYVRDALAWAHGANPEARLLINDYLVIPRGRYRDRYVELLGRLREAGAPLHAVGIQAHEPERGAYWFSPEEIWEACEVFGTRTGLPIYFTELWFTSDPAREIQGTHRRGRWSPELQAEAIEEFYRTAFGHPAVEAIIYFGLTDADPPGYPNVCLLDERYEPKPAWHRLRKLIREEWTTRVSANASDAGEVRFRGFYGAYEIVVREGPELWRFAWELRRGERRRAQFTLEPQRAEGAR